MDSTSELKTTDESIPMSVLSSGESSTRGQSTASGTSTTGSTNQNTGSWWSRRSIKEKWLILCMAFVGVVILLLGVIWTIKSVKGDSSTSPFTKVSSSGWSTSSRQQPESTRIPKLPSTINPSIKPEEGTSSIDATESLPESTTSSTFPTLEPTEAAEATTTSSSSSSTTQHSTLPDAHAHSCNDFYEYVCENRSRLADYWIRYYDDLEKAMGRIDWDGPLFVQLIAQLYFECIYEGQRSNRYLTAERCLKQIERDHTEVVMRIYVDYANMVTSGGKDLVNRKRTKAIELTVMVKDALNDLLTGNASWLDAQSKTTVNDKLSRMRMLIGYPDFIYQDELMGVIYGTVEELKEEKDLQNSTERPELTQIPSHQLVTGFFEKSLQLFKRQKEAGIERAIRWYTMKSDKQNLSEILEWLDVQSYIGSHYSQMRNVFNVPMFELHSPYYDLDYPALVNFAVKGCVAGHEMAHGFDRAETWYYVTDDLKEGEGEWKRVWSEPSEREFVDRSDCLKRQFDQLEFDVKNPYAKGVRVNGTGTLKENIADLTGIMAAFNAMKHYLRTHNSTDPLLYPPDLFTLYTPEQAFFVTHAKGLCRGAFAHQSESYFNRVAADRHAPHWHRVNEPLKNMHEFAQAFNCPVGSNMNPGHRCTMW